MWGGVGGEADRGVCRGRSVAAPGIGPVGNVASAGRLGSSVRPAGPWGRPDGCLRWSGVDGRLRRSGSGDVGGSGVQEVGHIGEGHLDAAVDAGVEQGGSVEIPR